MADIFGAIYSLILYFWQFQSSIKKKANTVANQIPARTHTLKTCLLQMLFFY